MRGRSDEQLVALVLDGHDAAFEVLFDRHVADSLWHAREVLGSWGDAEEAVRHSFAAAHAYLETRGRGTEFAPWLHTILGNYCLSMLQARKPAPAKPAQDAVVVDLGEWRLRRKLLGAALPIVPSAGLRESVMAACGIGGGAAAATAGAPLLGGTLAKLAVVAVLAGGVGTAGNVVSDRATPADAGPDSGAATAPGTAAPSGAAPGGALAYDPRTGLRHLTGATVGKRVSVPAPTHEALTVAERAPSEQAPVPSAPAASSDPATPPQPEGRMEIGDQTVITLAQSTPRRLDDATGTGVPEIEDLSETQLPGAADRLARVGEGLGALVGEPAADVRGLLHETLAAPD